MTISYQQYITSRFQVKLIQDVDFKHVGTLSMEQPAVILRCNFFFQQWNLYFVSCVLCNTPQNHYFVWGLSDNHVNCRLTELALSFAFSVGASSRRWICQLYWGYYFLSFHPAFIFFCFFFFSPSMLLPQRYLHCGSFYGRCQTTKLSCHCRWCWYIPCYWSPAFR